MYVSHPLSVFELVLLLLILLPKYSGCWRHNSRLGIVAMEVFHVKEARIHTRAWVQAVEEVRRLTSMPASNEREIEEWLEANREVFKQVVVAAYRDLAWLVGLSARYLDYFVSCVLSHHDGGTFHHSLPNWLAPGLESALGSPDGYYRVVCSPRRPATPENMTWDAHPLPCAFSVAWPNIGYVGQPDETAMSCCEYLVRKRIGERLEWFLRNGYAYLDPHQEGQWRDAPLLCGEGVHDKTIQEVLGIPADTLVVPTWTPIPYLYLENYEYRFNIRGGAPIDPLARPRVERDPGIDPDDERLASRCNEMLRLLVAAPAISGAFGGRPVSTQPTPGADKETYARQQYVTELAKLRDTPTESKLFELRKRVTRRAERQFPGAPELKPGWGREVERQEPWVRR